MRKRSFFFAMIGLWLSGPWQPSIGFGLEPNPVQEQATRLEFMKESTQVYRFTSVGQPAEIIEVHSDPALRWTNPVSGLKDGTLFFWTTAEGRPCAAAQVFLIENGIWLHEFQSLTTDSFRVTRQGTSIWTPSKPGLEWKSVPGSPVPASSAVQRLSQMKAMIDRFHASDEFEGNSRWELRPLAKPLLRYKDPRKDVVDGATFAFVHTTDPEVFILLEARSRKGGDPVWNYAIAPMTAYALKVTLDGDPVWEKPWLKEPFRQTDPYQILTYQP